MPVYRRVCTYCDGTFDIEGHRATSQCFQICSFCGHLNRLPEVITEADAIDPAQPRDLCFSGFEPYDVLDLITILSWHFSDCLTEPIAAFETNIRRLHSLISVGHFTPSCENLPAEQWRIQDAILTSQIVGMWTAFEVLAGDIWEASLNAAPTTLATLSASRGSASKNDAMPTIQLDKLSKYGFRVHDKMGTILKDRIGFTKLSSISEAYAKAFDDPTVRSLICNTSRPNSFDTLSFVRNVLVHSGGIADDDFAQRAKHHATFKEILPGKRLPLTGKIAHDVVADAFADCIALIKAVDDWLHLNL